MQATLEFAAEWRRLGARVTFEPGWETRGNGQSANYEGAEIHHTAFLSSPANPFPAKNTLIRGRVDLSGPLCNSAGPYCEEGDPWIHVVAAHPANHAGASGGAGTAPFPKTSLFNPLVWGHETDYGGVVAMSAGQRKAALIVGRGVTNVLGKGVDWIKGHAETSITGKWDPGYAPGKTIDLGAFRRDAAALTGGDELDAEQNRKIDQTYRLVCFLAGVEVSPPAPNEKTIGQQVREATIGGAGVVTETGGPQALDPVLSELFANSRATLRAVGVLASPPGGAAPAGPVVQALPHEQLVELARLVNEGADRRDRDGDPSTGAVS